MGFLDFLRGRAARETARVEDDAVWLHQRAKVAGLRRHAEEGAATRCVLVLAQFPATLRSLQEELASSPAWSVLEQEADTASFLTRRAGAALAPAWSVPSHQLDAVQGELEVLVAERHPLRSHDEEIVEAVGRLPGRPRMTFHVSLDEPLFGEARQRIGDLLERLGMDDGEAIRQAFVTQAIARAQGQIAERARGDQPADSAGEWLQLNIG